MEKTSCNEKVCKRCGWCCTNLGKEIDLTEDEELKLKKHIFNKVGVVYIRTLRKFYLALSPEEARVLKNEAKKLGINLEVLPNKLIYDKDNNKVIVYDYYLNHDSCPFYKKNLCTVYEKRPASCRQFPSTKRSYMKEVEKFIKKRKINLLNTYYDETVEKCREFLKKSNATAGI
ncbi:YkgJ family cysteine cluster protein [Candidatus Woesearchaeota archaeon]|nr:YkgJ family cysteine cluster protein [Candidatus Woesearchaeota archaeon]